MSERENMDLTPEQQRIQASLRGLGEVRADDAFRARLREQFVSGELAADSGAAAEVVTLPRRRPRRAWAMAALPAIAAVLVIIFLGGRDVVWQLEDVRGTGIMSVNGHEVKADERSAVAGLIGSGARIAVPAGVEVDVVLGKILVMGVAGPADFTLPDSPQEEPYLYQATIHEGEFRVKTGPRFPGREVLLLTTEGRVEITGTTVAVFKDTDVTCVCVLEGTALIGKDSEHLDAVSAGMRKVMFGDGREPMIIPIEPGHRDGLLEFEEYNADTFTE